MFAARVSYFTAAGRFHKLVTPWHWTKDAEKKLNDELRLAIQLGAGARLPEGVKLFGLGLTTENESFPSRTA